MNSFVNARILIKSLDDDVVLADSVILDHQLDEGNIWVKAENFNIKENTKIEALIITSDTIYDCLCTARKWEPSTGQIFAIYKYKSYEERKDNRFRMAAEGSMMVVVGTDELKNRRIGVSVIDISAGGIGLIMSEQLPVENGSLCEVYFSKNEWAMKAKCVVKNIFGPRLGCRLVAYEKQQLKSRQENIDPNLKSQINRAMEEIRVCAHYIDCEKDTFIDLGSMDYVKYAMGNELSARKNIEKMIQYTAAEEDKERLRKFYNLDDLKERMRGKRIYSIFYVGRHLGMCQISFVPASRDENGEVKGVLHVVQKLDEEAYKEALDEEEAEYAYVDEKEDESTENEEESTENEKTKEVSKEAEKTEAELEEESIIEEKSDSGRLKKRFKGNKAK